MPNVLSIRFNNIDIYAEEKNGEIIKIGFKKRKNRNVSFILSLFKKQVKEYMKGERKRFEIPFKIEAREFDKKVYQVLLSVPYGATITYKELAEKVGNKKAARAVGQALSRNPLPLIIPCHRVIKSNGEIGGFTAGEKIKAKLLEIEGVKFNKNCF